MSISLTQSGLGFPLHVSSYQSLNHADSPTASGLRTRAGWSVRQGLQVKFPGSQQLVR